MVLMKSMRLSEIEAQILGLPTIRLITMIPISFGGLGIREVVFVYFFSFVRVSPEISVAIGFIWWYILRVLNAIIGGVLNVFE